MRVKIWSYDHAHAHVITCTCILMFVSLFIIIILDYYCMHDYCVNLIVVRLCLISPRSRPPATLHSRHLIHLVTHFTIPVCVRGTRGRGAPTPTSRSLSFILRSSLPNPRLGPTISQAIRARSLISWRPAPYRGANFLYKSPHHFPHHARPHITSPPYQPPMPNPPSMVAA